MNTYQFLIQEFEQLPLLIQFVWALSFILFVIVAILIGFLKILRSQLRRKEKITTRYRKQYESLLISFLSSGSGDNTINSEQQAIIDNLKLHVKDKFKRKIVVEVLFKLRNEISGEMAELIQELYVLVGLKDFAYDNLRNKNWYIVANGIRELTQFHIKEAYDEIRKYINHSKKEVQYEVELYMVSLFRFEGLKFLNVLKTTLSEWEQIQLLEILQRNEDQQLQDITPWLKSPNNSVVTFALKLAKIYNQFDVKDSLIELLENENEEIRIEAIQTLGHLNIVEIKKVLKNSFDKRSLREQILFFKVLENLCDEKDEPFIMEHISSSNFEIKLSALKILKVLNIEKLTALKNPSSDVKFGEMLNFVINS